MFLVFLFVAQDPRYGYFIFWNLGSEVRDIVKWENANISAPGPKIKKLMTLYFLQLFKFEKAKYPYFFNLLPRGRDIGLFFLTIAHAPPPEAQKTQCPYFRSWATNQKTKDTFFSSTFKVWESKVSLFFQFMAQGPRYWPFFPWRWHVLLLFLLKSDSPEEALPSWVQGWFWCFWNHWSM